MTSRDVTEFVTKSQCDVTVTSQFRHNAIRVINSDLTVTRINTFKCSFQQAYSYEMQQTVQKKLKALNYSIIDNMRDVVAF